MMENRWSEADLWINDRRSADTDIYANWLRTGEFDKIQDDNSHILELRKIERKSKNV